MTKPIASVIGEDGNVFNILAICSKALEKEGMRDRAKEMQERVFDSESYDDALRIMSEYVEME